LLHCFDVLLLFRDFEELGSSCSSLVLLFVSVHKLVRIFQARVFPIVQFCISLLDICPHHMFLVSDQASKNPKQQKW